jgi:hypothetical protein
MKNAMLAGLLLVAAAASAQAFDDKDDVKAAAKKLADAPNYSWTSTTKNNAETPGPGAGRFAPGPMEGKTEKDGVTWYSMKMGENTFETAMKGDKFAMKFKDAWMGSGDVPAGGQPGRPDPSMFASRMMKNLKPIAQNVNEAIDKLKEIKSEGDGVYSGEFTPEGAKDQLAPNRGQGQGNTPPAVSDAKGSVKIWVKDGIIVKLESTLQGKLTMGTREIVMDRTVTTEIKDVGSTKIELPDEAKKKLE